jgi:hypothetical protein
MTVAPVMSETVRLTALGVRRTAPSMFRAADWTSANVISGTA